MSEKFEDCFNEVVAIENACSTCEDLAKDCKFGITQKTYDDFLSIRRIRPRQISKMTNEEARSILYDQFWVPLNAEKLPKGLDFALFESSVHSSLTLTVKALQAALELPERDGFLGLTTLAAINKTTDNATNIFELNKIIESFYRFRENSLKDLKGWRRNGRAWKMRLAFSKRVAEARAGVTQGVPGRPLLPYMPLRNAAKASGKKKFFDLKTKAIGGSLITLEAVAMIARDASIPALGEVGTQVAVMISFIFATTAIFVIKYIEKNSD